MPYWVCGKLFSFLWYYGTMSEASTLTNKIIQHIYSSGGFAWRASSTGVYDQKAGSYRTAAKKGVSDVLACFRGRLIAIEIKIGKDRLSDEQIGFMRNIEHVGGIAFVAGNFDEFVNRWNLLVNDF